MKVENLAADAEDFTGNVWKISNEETVLIDAGTGDSWERISELEGVDKVILTHSHPDHIGNLERIVEKYDPEVYAFEPENLGVNAEQVSEGDKVELCGTEFQVFHTPGHKDDSICLYGSEERVLFAGDLLFPAGGFGRTDLDEGDRDLLIESIEKIADLDVKEMYCGHESAATKDVNDQIQRSLESARKRQPKY